MAEDTLQWLVILKVLLKFLIPWLTKNLYTDLVTISVQEIPAPWCKVMEMWDEVEDWLDLKPHFIHIFFCKFMCGYMYIFIHERTYLYRRKIERKEKKKDQWKKQERERKAAL
jgi:hypothetical protein